MFAITVFVNGRHNSLITDNLCFRVLKLKFILFFLIDTNKWIMVLFPGYFNGMRCISLKNILCGRSLRRRYYRMAELLWNRLRLLSAIEFFVSVCQLRYLLSKGGVV